MCCQHVSQSAFEFLCFPVRGNPLNGLPCSGLFFHLFPCFAPCDGIRICQCSLHNHCFGICNSILFQNTHHLRCSRICLRITVLAYMCIRLHIRRFVIKSHKRDSRCLSRLDRLSDGIAIVRPCNDAVHFLIDQILNIGHFLCRIAVCNSHNPVKRTVMRFPVFLGICHKIVLPRLIDGALQFLPGETDADHLSAAVKIIFWIELADLRCSFFPRSRRLFFRSCACFGRRFCLRRRLCRTLLTARTAAADQ